MALSVRAGRTPRAPRAPLARALSTALRILYADAHIVVVDKPSGLLSVPGRTAAPDALALSARAIGSVAAPSGSGLWSLRERSGGDSHADALPHPLTAVHRLDEATSGLLVFARSALAASALGRAFAARRVSKL
jgi:tRNA pseudouridine32 synthase / 23S rRNA pseudouridine746 synthase